MTTSGATDMTHGYLAGLAAGLLVVTAGVANAAMVTIPMELSSWSYHTQGGEWEMGENV